MPYCPALTADSPEHETISDGGCTQTAQAPYFGYTMVKLVPIVLAPTDVVDLQAPARHIVGKPTATYPRYRRKKRLQNSACRSSRAGSVLIELQMFDV
jgi:hypothetical protein